MKKLLIAFLMVMLFPIVAMAGWEQDEVGTRYKNEDGTYLTGWYQDVDEKWYYLDDATGYVLVNATTPDGYCVNEEGEWVEVKGESNMNSYENKKEFVVTGYGFGPSSIRSLGFSLPTTVYYNNNYMCDGGRKLKILGFEVSKDGVLFAQYSMDEATYRYNVEMITRYIMEDQSSIDIKSTMSSYCEEAGLVVSTPAMEYQKNKISGTPIRAEVYINAEKK